MEKVKKMTQEMRAEICSRAILYYGAKAQLVMTMEELSELQKACSKIYRNIDLVVGESWNDADRLKKAALLENLAEEVADVYIMINQLKKVFPVQKTITEYMDIKLARLNDTLIKEGVRLHV